MPPPEKKSFLHEICGLLSLTLGIFLCIALLSYSPNDPSFNSASSLHSTQNYVGVVGSYLADLLISGFGLASYLAGVFLFLAAYLCFTQKRARLSAGEGGLLALAWVMVAVLFQLHWDSIQLYSVPTMAGGLVGALIGEQLRRYLSTFGSYLFVVTVGLLALVWGAKISLTDLYHRTREILAVVGEKLSAWRVIYQARFEKWWDKYQEVRKQRRAETAEPPAPAPKKPRVSSKPLVEAKNPTVKEALQPKPPPPEPRFPGSEPKIVQRSLPKSEKHEEQLAFDKMTGQFQLPSLALLDPVPETRQKNWDEESIKVSSVLLENKLRDYGVEGRITEIHPGPVVTMYEFEPAAGVKVNKITNLADDLSLSMGGRPVRIEAPLPGKPAVGIEIPNIDRETVYFKEIVADSSFQKSDSKLALALGKDIAGVPISADLSKMPHLLVAGATGAGKSVGLNSFILSLLFKNSPEDVRFIFIDPKMLELSIYADIPHLLLPVVTHPKKATLALIWAVKEMERRYRLLSDAQVRNIGSYNKKFEQGGFADHKPKPMLPDSDEEPIKHEEKLPYIVIIIDELADLMMVSGREIEEYITRLAQMARAAGIHMILATQRPSVDVITGIIKANFPSRISFKVTSKHDSRTILDTVGAEHLLGNGDMLFIPPGLSKQMRVHGAYVSDQEIHRVVKYLRDQSKPVYNEEILNMKLPSQDLGPDGEESDELYDQAVALITETRQASISMVQRRFRIGYNRAARLIERMEGEGIVSAPMGAKGREVLARGYGTDG